MRIAMNILVLGIMGGLGCGGAPRPSGAGSTRQPDGCALSDGALGPADWAGSRSPTGLGLCSGALATRECPRLRDELRSAGAAAEDDHVVVIRGHRPLRGLLGLTATEERLPARAIHRARGCPSRCPGPALSRGVTRVP